MRGGKRGGKSGEEDIFLHCARALKHRELVDAFRVRIGANHVRLSREDEDFDGRGRDRDRGRGRVEGESGQGESTEELKESHGGAMGAEMACFGSRVPLRLRKGQPSHADHRRHA
jgi:hypothetical protein